MPETAKAARTLPTGMVVAALTALAVTALAFGASGYPLFHAAIEVMAAVVALSVFTIAWHARRIAESDYVTFIGLACLPVGIVTILHALAYKGMPVFPGYGTNLPTQLWLIARLLQAAGFLIAPIFLTRRLTHPTAWLAGFTVAGAAAVAAAFAGVLPAAFVEGVGLTPTKIAIEYVVIAATVVGAAGLAAGGRRLDAAPRYLLYGSMAATIVAEFLFTLYSDPFGLSNRIGHAAHLTAFMLIYAALVRTSLERPLDTLFRELTAKERALGIAFEAEHGIAETLQDALALQPERVPGLRLSHRYSPAPGSGRIGGDFYDLHRVGDNLVAFSIGDVCGKGITAAVSTMKARSALRAMALRDPEPSAVLDAVNDYLYRELSPESFVTAIYGTIDTRSGRLRLAVAGHPAPIVCGRPEVSVPDDFRAPPLGVVAALGARTFETVLAPGETVVLVTDGVLEADSPDGGRRFGEGRLAELLHSAGCGETAEKVVERIFELLAQYSGGRRVEDDVAVVAIQREG